MYKVLKISDESLVLAKEDGRLKQVPADDVDFPLALGDLVDVYEDGDLLVVLPHQMEQELLAMDDQDSTQSTLLRGIMDLFAETLALYSRDKAGIGRLFPQFLTTLFLAWALMGVLAEQLLLMLLSLVVTLWRLLMRLVNWLMLDRDREDLTLFDADDTWTEGDNPLAQELNAIDQPADKPQILHMDRASTEPKKEKSEDRYEKEDK